MPYFQGNAKTGPRQSIYYFSQGGYFRWYGDNLWTFVRRRTTSSSSWRRFPGYPFQEGSSLNAAGINYTSLRLQDTPKRLQSMEGFTPSR
jgi:arylsulfatase